MVLSPTLHQHHHIPRRPASSSMTRIPPPDQRFRLTASTIASYFKHHCDRLFRWNTVEGPNRARPGIGWNVPAKIRKQSRPGITLLMQAGDEFEVSNVERLIEEVGAENVRFEGIEQSGTRRIITTLPFVSFAEELRNGKFTTYTAQIEIAFLPDQQARFLQSFGLDPQRIRLGTARPDLLEVIGSDDPGERPLLRVWDFKGSQRARHEHFVQVAFYSLLLEHALREEGIDTIGVDTSFGVIRARTEDVAFELAPYRLAVDDFLRNHVDLLFDLPAADAHFHVHEPCAMCEYMDTCRSEADAGSDLSRIAYISGESKRRLRALGVATHRELARLDDPERIEQLRTFSHDLSLHLPRYIETARALEDGIPRPLGTTTLLMPQYEDIRIVICAEQDAVTGTCFALGIKTYEGWDAEAGRPLGGEHVFVAASPESEGEILHSFLRTLNTLLRRVDAENRAMAAESVDDDPTVAEAGSRLTNATQALLDFKERHGRLLKAKPEHAELILQREALKLEEKEATSVLKQAKKDAAWERRKSQKRLHFYVYDRLDLLVLHSLVERHLFSDDASPELIDELRHLIRLFPPSSILPDADTFRTVPGSVVTQVLRATVALPTPYLYDLRSVSQAYQPISADGEEKGYLFRPRYGFGWEHSNQIAFERIHDVWEGNRFSPDPRDSSRDMEPAAVLEMIEQTAVNKLRATDSIIRRLKKEIGERLLLRKEPFRLFEEFDPIDFQTLEALRIFTVLEASLGELQVKGQHTLAVEDRAAKFVCISGLRYQPGLDEADGSLWFTFDPASRDVRFDVGDFNLVVTPESMPGILVGDIDGKLFERGWRHENYKVTLTAYDLAADTPRVRLLPNKPDKFRESVDLSERCVLDQLYVDYTTHRTIDILERLREDGGAARHIHELVAAGTVASWSPFVERTDEIEAELVRRAGGDRPILNTGQWRAFHGVMAGPLTLVWGPPGTGKTYTVAHILIGYALAAVRRKKELRILVTAFTHHAIANVLMKVAELAERYGFSSEELAIGKLQGMGANAADELLPERVERWEEKRANAYLLMGTPCVIMGATVWAIHKGMKETDATIRQWFDVVLIDEASQMRIPDALIALAASKPTANIVLAGDDQQLPPIIHGTYPEQHEDMLGSVFSFMRARMNERERNDPEARERMLFMLEENFRMNEPLTAYPRDILYDGRFTSTKPGIRIRTRPELDVRSDDPLDAMLHPDRPSVLCWYTPPRGFTSRNPIEAEIVARLASRLSEILIDDGTREIYDHRAFAAQGLAILSPHRAQNSAIRGKLAEVGFGVDGRPMPLVDTVEKLQGKERDAVLVSYGVADEEYAEAEADFLLSRNRFNVAATRARHKLVVLCSDVVLDVVPSDHDILVESMMLKEFRAYCSDGILHVPWTTEEFGEIMLTIQWKGFPS